VGGLGRRIPIRGTFPCCCASAGKRTAKSTAQTVKGKIAWVIGFSSRLSPRHSPQQKATLTLPALVLIINETTVVQFFDEAHMTKVLGFGSFCLGLCLR